MSDVKITVDDVSKVFYKKGGSTAALRHVTLQVREGEFVCLLGPSGCGKSTLLRILAGLEKPSSGSFTIRPGSRDRPLQSMVFQENGVIPWMTVWENVAFGLKVRGAPGSVVRSRVEEYLEKTGLSESARLYPKELSGGMKQRVSIARAFANDPEILLMDEPFASLDEQNKIILQEELLTIWAETKKTVVFITHNIDEALLLSDRMELMSSQPGTITESIDVRLDRPRTIEKVRADSGMAKLFVKIHHHLRQEVTASRTAKNKEDM
ncbi:ABC transporter ATP-binding protein [Sporolactobacillus sp. Y61]|uniref:ABC transporter ATP-binding protein n=1 Tax=Sporolactobacillus sp. Y61 TaxID=3160863 RepID=A0AAU8IG38_9BACL